MDEAKLRAFISGLQTCQRQFDKISALNDPEGHVFDELSSHLTEMEALVVLPSARAKFKGSVAVRDGDEETNIVYVIALLIPSLLAFTAGNEAATAKIVIKVLGIVQKLSNEPSMRELMVLPSVNLLKTLCEILREPDFSRYKHDILMIFFHLSQDTSPSVKAEMAKSSSLLQLLLTEISYGDVDIRLTSVSLSIIGYLVLDKDVRAFISTSVEISLSENIFGLLNRIKSGDFEFHPSKQSEKSDEERMSEEEHNSLLKDSRVSALWIVRSIVQEAAGMNFVKQIEENFQLVYHFAMQNKKSDDHILHIFETILFSPNDSVENGHAGNDDLLEMLKVNSISLALLAKYDIHEFFINLVSSGKKKMKNNMNAKRSLHLLLLLSLSSDFVGKMQSHVKLQAMLWDFMRSDKGYVGLRSALLLARLYVDEEEFSLFSSEGEVGTCLLSFRVDTENVILPIIHKHLCQIVAMEGTKGIEEHAIGRIPLLLLLHTINTLSNSSNRSEMVSFFDSEGEISNFDPLLKCLHFEEWVEKKIEEWENTTATTATAATATSSDKFNAKEVSYAFLILSTLFFDARLIQKYGYFGVNTWTSPPAPSQGFTVIGNFMSFYVNELEAPQYEHFDTSMYNICSWWLQKFYSLSQPRESEENDSKELLVLLHYSNQDFHRDDKMATLFAQEGPLEKHAVELNCFDLSAIMKDESMLTTKKLIQNFRQEMSFANVQVIFLSPSFRDDIMMRYLVMEMEDFYSTFKGENKGNTIFVQWEPGFIFDGNNAIRKDLGWIHTLLTESKYNDRKMSIIRDPATLHEEIMTLLGPALDEKKEEKGEREEEKEEEEEEKEGDSEESKGEGVEEEKEEGEKEEQKEGIEEEKKEGAENKEEGIDTSKEEGRNLCDALLHDIITIIIDQQEHERRMQEEGRRTQQQEKRINQAIVSSYAQGIVSSKLTSTIKSISNQMSYEKDKASYEKDKASKEMSIDVYMKQLEKLELQHQSQEHKYLGKIQTLQVELQEKVEQEKVLREKAVEDKLSSLEQQHQSQENSYLEKIKELQVALQARVTEQAVRSFGKTNAREDNFGEMKEDASDSSSAIDDQVIENDESNEIEECNFGEDGNANAMMAPIEPHETKPSYTSPLKNLRSSGGNGLSSTFASASIDEYGQHPGIFEGNSMSSQSILLNSHVPLPGGFSVNPQESTIDIGDPLEYVLNINKLKASSLREMKALLTELGIDSTFELLQCDAETLQRIGTLLKPIPQKVFLKEFNGY